MTFDHRHRRRVVRTIFAVALGFVLFGCGIPAAFAQDEAEAEPLRVSATVPELGSLVRQIGGEHVEVTVFAKGTEDPHFVQVRPSFIRTVKNADLFVQVGMGMEIGWAPTLLQRAGNPRVLPGASGYVDASTVITPLGVPTGQVDRSMGDVHPTGNPHYLLDPVNGLRVAQLLRDRLRSLRPAHGAYFASRYEDFHQRLGSALVGDALAGKYDVEKLALLYEHGRLLPFLQSQGEAPLLGGWFEAMAVAVGTKVVGDHTQWAYFANRFRLNIIGYMEPKPGIPPTTRHLRELIETMRAQNVRLILMGAYYDPRHGRFLAQHTGAKVVDLAHQGGARPGTEEYLQMIDYNVRQCIATLEGA